MWHNWQGGCIDRQDPRAPISTPLASDITVVEGVQPPTQLVPAQFQIASQSSIEQALAEGSSAGQDDLHHCSQPGSVQVVEADVSWPGGEVAAEPHVFFFQEIQVWVWSGNKKHQDHHMLLPQVVHRHWKNLFISQTCVASQEMQLH